jgi:hypothetical protein
MAYHSVSVLSVRSCFTFLVVFRLFNKPELHGRFHAKTARESAVDLQSSCTDEGRQGTLSRLAAYP